MHSYYWLVLFFLAAVPAVLMVPTTSHWGDMRIRHIWGVVPENWESLGPPPAGTTINLRIALKPHRETALIDTLREVSSPNHPRHVSSSSVCAYIHVNCFSGPGADTARTCRRSRLLTLSRPILMLSGSSSPGFNTTAFPPLPSR